MGTLWLTALRPVDTSVRVASTQYFRHGVRWTIGPGSSTNEGIAIGVAEWVVLVASTIVVGIGAGTIFVDCAIAVIINAVATNLRLWLANSLARTRIIDRYASTIRLAGVLIGLAITTTDGRP